MWTTTFYRRCVAILGAVLLSSVAWAADTKTHHSSSSSTETSAFSEQEVMDKANAFFGETTEGLAKAIEKVFADQGKPNAIITGEELSAALGVGVRYGQGELQMVSGETMPVFWQGPSVGFDLGANAAKVFTLVYNLNDVEKLFQRFPGVEGSIYVVAGVGVNYQKSGDMVLAPIRTGVGLRSGANVGYLHYNKEKSWIPF